MTSGPNFFPKIVKIMGIIPKFPFFQKKSLKICCSQKKIQVPMLFDCVAKILSIDVSMALKTKLDNR